jgi:xanthosine utilization system XapX-like protein
MVNGYAVAHLISGIIFGTLSMASLANAAISFAMVSIFSMLVIDTIISKAEKKYSPRN